MCHAPLSHGLQHLCEVLVAHRDLRKRRREGREVADAHGHAPAARLLETLPQLRVLQDCSLGVLFGLPLLGEGKAVAPSIALLTELLELELRYALLRHQTPVNKRLLWQQLLKDLLPLLHVGPIDQICLDLLLSRHCLRIQHPQLRQPVDHLRPVVGQLHHWVRNQDQVAEEAEALKALDLLDVRDPVFGDEELPQARDVFRLKGCHGRDAVVPDVQHLHLLQRAHPLQRRQLVLRQEERPQAQAVQVLDARDVVLGEVQHPELRVPPQARPDLADEVPSQVQLAEVLVDAPLAQGAYHVVGHVYRFQRLRRGEALRPDQEVVGRVQMQQAVQSPQWLQGPQVVLGDVDKLQVLVPSDGIQGSEPQVWNVQSQEGVLLRGRHAQHRQVLAGGRFIQGPRVLGDVEPLVRHPGNWLRFLACLGHWVPHRLALRRLHLGLQLPLQAVVLLGRRQDLVHDPPHRLGELGGALEEGQGPVPQRELRGLGLVHGQGSGLRAEVRAQADEVGRRLASH
mmetsp:Transcript_19750/g.55683  ORF Transcript_19750/g.55683 Transcript_19750/m.55683 type:complete len:512 (-) Transcript_19750:365-1900(-)